MAISLDDIKNFIVVSETLNVTRASEILGISQPTLSYSIKRLEQQLNYDLIIRLKTGIKLSKGGETFLLKAKKLIFEWESLENTSSNNLSDFRGKYIFAIHPSVALRIVEDFIPSITKAIPEININFIHGLSREMTEKVISWEADFGIVVNPVKHPDLVIKVLKKDCVGLFKTKNCKKKLIYDPSLNQVQTILKSIKNLDYNGEIHSNNLELIAKLASLGEGVALIPESVASQFENLSRVKSSPTYDDLLCLVYRPEKHMNEVSRKIIQTILK